MTRQQVDGVVEEVHQLQGQCLYLVEHQHRIGQGMQPADGASSGSKERLQHLDHRSKDDRSVPVFRQYLAAPTLAVAVLLFRQIRVVLQHNAGKLRLFGFQRFAHHGGILIDDGKLGAYKNHAVLSVAPRVLHRKPQRRKRLSSAGRYGKGIDSSRTRRSRKALRGDLPAYPVYFPLSRELSRGGIQPCEQDRPTLVHPILPKPCNALVFEVGGIRTVRVDQAAKAVLSEL